MNLLTSVFDVSKNLILNTMGIKRDLLKLMADKDVSTAKGLFIDNDERVGDAIKEYDPSRHDVMKRPNKQRKKGRDPYITQKLPRSWQRYINEIALFFLLAKPVRFMANTSGEDGKPDKDLGDAFDKYKGFLKDTRFDANMRKFKRMSGAETEAAKLYHLYQGEDGKSKCKVVVMSRQTGYYLRPLIDQYGIMKAFGYGYFVKEGSETVEHFDIDTPEYLYKCKKLNLGWDVEIEANPVGKIRVIYANQEKEWAGCDERIARDEMLDSKSADTNEYFADPIALATAGVIKEMADPETVGKLVQMASKEDDLRYLEPPSSVEMKESEKKVLHNTILQDSFTPDLSYENMKGMGTLSGEALKRALILGYIKRDNRKEVYDELMDREINLIMAILTNVIYKGEKGFDKLQVTHEFAEPFDEDTEKRVGMIVDAYAGGVISLELAVKMLGFSSKTDDEMQRIIEDQKRKNEVSSLPISGL